MSTEITKQTNGAISQQMTNPVQVSSESTFDQVYEEINVPCPTCRGTGRISRDSALLQEAVALTTDPKKSASSDGVVPIDKTIFTRIKDEMKNLGVSQTVFAAVAFDKTQGLLSEILRRGASGVNLEGSRSLCENLRQIESFLNKPAKERMRMYGEYKGKSKSWHRLNREYSEGLPSSGRRVTISTHAKGVLNEFRQQVSSNPDKLALKVLSEALGIQKAAILKYFQTLNKTNPEQSFDTSTDVTVNFDLPDGYMNAAPPMDP